MAQAAARYFGVKNVHCFFRRHGSHRFNPRAAKAMQEVGFDIRKTSEGDNPVYEARFAMDAPPLFCSPKIR